MACTQSIHAFLLNDKQDQFLAQTIVLLACVHAPRLVPETAYLAWSAGMGTQPALSPTAHRQRKTDDVLLCQPSVGETESRTSFPARFGLCPVRFQRLPQPH